MKLSDLQKSGGGQGYDFGIGFSLAQNPVTSAVSPLTVTGGGNSGRNTSPNWQLIALVVSIASVLIVWISRR